MRQNVNVHNADVSLHPTLNYIWSVHKVVKICRLQLIRLNDDDVIRLSVKQYPICRFKKRESV